MDEQTNINMDNIGARLKVEFDVEHQPLPPQMMLLLSQLSEKEVHDQKWK